MKRCLIEIGDVVFSLKGRDRGKLYYVVWKDENYAQIANGKLRKLEKPKVKKLKHLKKIDINLDEYNIKDFLKVSNKKIHKNLSYLSKIFND